MINKHESLKNKHYIYWQLNIYHNMMKNGNFMLWKTSHPNIPTTLYFENNPMVRLKLMSFLGSTH